MLSLGNVICAEFALQSPVENEILNEKDSKRRDHFFKIVDNSTAQQSRQNDYGNLGAIRKTKPQTPSEIATQSSEQPPSATVGYFSKQVINNKVDNNKDNHSSNNYYDGDDKFSYPKATEAFDANDHDDHEEDIDDVFGFNSIKTSHKSHENSADPHEIGETATTAATSESEYRETKTTTGTYALPATNVTTTPRVATTPPTKLTKYRSTHVNSSPNTLSAKYRSLIMITKDQQQEQDSNQTIATRASEINNSPAPDNSSSDSDSVSASVNCCDASQQSSEQIQQMHKAKQVSSHNSTNNISDGNDSSSLPTYLKISSSHHKENPNTPSAKSDLVTSPSPSIDLLRDQSITSNDNDDEIGVELYDANRNVYALTTRANASDNGIGSGAAKIPVCLEDGLADDDSWVEELSEQGDAVDVCQEDDDDDDTTPTATDSEDGDDPHSMCMFNDREEELRGYHRTAIDFTLHTIVEESCEESEVASLRSQTDEEELDDLERRRQKTLQHHHRLSASELEKYFFFGLGDGKVMVSIPSQCEETASEVSSVYSEDHDSLGAPDESANDASQAADLASSRLEKYFLSGFMGFNAAEKNGSDESGSVGSDSEGHPSPSQRRKRLVRARTTPRSHNSSLDNLLVDSQANDSLENTLMANNSQDIMDSSESEACDETVLHNSSASERASDGTDTMKRKKQLRKRHDSLDEKKFHEPATEDANKTSSLECRTPTPGSMQNSQAKKQQHHSRDSGFVGSNDDLLKSPDSDNPSTYHTRTKSPNTLEQIKEDNEKLVVPIPAVRLSTVTDTNSSGSQSENVNKKLSLLPSTSSASCNLVRKDSFNNWSSDEETNLMMSKMRQFFKTLVVATANAQQQNSASNSKSTTPNQTTPISVRRMKSRPATLAYFENELTRLMKTVPGINDEQVREIVEYLSSEDTWSDSYDSSDYTSSDLEGSSQRRNELKQQISASCQQIINKFEVDEEGDRGDGGLLEDPRVLSTDTALVYQKLVASFSKMAVDNATASPEEPHTTEPEQVVTESGGSASSPQKRQVEEDQISTGSTHSAEKSPQLFARVMQHIGTRLVALMHEVSSGNDTHGTNSPMPTQRHNQHKRLQAKISATTTEDEEDTPTEDRQMGTSRTPQYLHPSHAYAQHMYQTSRTGIYTQDEAFNLARSKSHDLLLDSASTSLTAASNSSTGSSTGNHNAAAHNRPHHHQSSSGVSDTAGEECGVASDYERFSWRGSFESALLANGDSRTKLSQLDRDNSSSASALAVAKRRSAGDLLFNHKSLSREQLDRVRSCGSIGGGDEHHHVLESSPAKPWLSSSTDSKDARRSSVPDAIYETDTSSSDDCDAFAGTRSTLPRSLLGVTQMSTTNSLPRLPTTTTAAASASATNTTISNLGAAGSTSALATGVSATSTPISKSQNFLNFPSSNSAKSARYRPAGLKPHHNFGAVNIRKGTQAHAQSLQQFLYPKRDARKRLNMSMEEAKAAAEELSRSPVMGQHSHHHDPASSPLQSRGSASSENWPQQSDEDIDRLVAMHQNRSSLSSLGLRSDSMASVYSGAGEGRYGTVAVKGQVEFGMQYNYKLGALEIHVVRCKDLAAVDTKRNRSDPYVKVYLLPDKSKAGKRKTKVKKHTLNPIFDEVLRFHMPISSLESRTLWLTVWHSDMFGRNDFLGEVSVNLQGRVFDNPQSQWYLLQERSEPFDEVATYRGDIVVGLKYVPPEGSKSSFMRSLTSGTGGLRKFGSIKSVATSKTDRSAKGGQLHVLVKEAKHLTPIKPNGSCDAFCKSYLLPDRTRSSKQKTPIVKRSTNPSWTYTFVYEDVSLEDLSERALELTVWDHDRLASNEFLGGVRFSLGSGKSYGRLVDWMDASGKELSLWQNMLDRPNFWVEGSVILRSSLDGIRAIP